jgi:prepilin-type N-terminal cleavage/methylation domain-containing protein
MRDTAPQPPARRRVAAASGFTLVELMISIVLVLILILGVNQVFKIATDSVGAGQAISDQSRDNRAVQTVLFNDFAQSIIRQGDSPCFVIRSRRTPAFLDQEEMLSDADYMALATTATRTEVDLAVRTLDLNGNNVEGEAAVPGEIIQRHDLRQRNYRLDIMGFFARYLYPRQTGNDGVYAANMSSSEAWIWYGHLRQPQDFSNTSGVNVDPGWDATSTPPATPQRNPNNFYARQWGLGRVAVLLVAPTPQPAIGPGVYVLDKAGVPQRFHYRVANADPYNYTPLGQHSVSTDGSTTDAYNKNVPPPASTAIQYSRYDLAGTTIDTYRSTLKTNGAFNTFPWPPGESRWYSAGGIAHRFTGYPFPVKPLNSYGVSRTVPWLIGGCTSFIVEYAGDFVTQNLDPTSPTHGAVLSDYTTAAPDGVVDFFVVPTVPPTRQTRWYGFPRDTTGDGTVSAQATPATLPASRDVLPLRDFMPSGVVPPHERFNGLAVANYNNLTLDSEYTAGWQPPGTYINETTGAAMGDPPRPKMVRVTMTIDDPRGRLPSGNLYEYVIELP